LEDEGLTLDDVTISAVPSSSYIDAFRNKGVDAIIATELHLSRLLADGNAVVMTGSEDVVGYTQTSLLAFGKNLLKEHPEVGVRFMAAYLKGVAQYNQGKTERNLQIMAEATGEPIDLLENSCWLAINSDGWIDFSIVDQFQTWSVGMGHMEKPITEEQFWDPSFLEAAIELIESE
jgi:ABC-type nitrate/sulfonate/bicarbonate transport system substrate-binding protein